MKKYAILIFAFLAASGQCWAQVNPGTGPGGETISINTPSHLSPYLNSSPIVVAGAVAANNGTPMQWIRVRLNPMDGLAVGPMAWEGIVATNGGAQGNFQITIPAGAAANTGPAKTYKVTATGLGLMTYTPVAEAWIYVRIGN